MAERVDNDLSTAVDERIAKIHDRLGLREVSRARGEDGVIRIALERKPSEES